MISSNKGMLSAYLGKTLLFRQLSVFKRNYELVCEDEVLGNLEMTGIFNCNSKIKILGKEWEIRKDSIWKKNAGIYLPGYELPMAEYSPKLFSDGVLKLEKGVVFLFSYDLWKGISEVKTESGAVLISVKNKSWWKHEREVSIQKKNEIIDSKPWILMLLLYIDERRQHRSAAVA